MVRRGAYSYGDVECSIKAGTQGGSKIRLKGKGISSMKNPSVKGDQYVTVEISVPRSYAKGKGSA